MWYFQKKYYVFHSNSEKNPVLTKFFIIKNKHFNLISLTLLFQHVDLIFSKIMLYFSDISREDSFKISHEINFSEKYECQNDENKNNVK